METHIFGYPVHLLTLSQSLDWAERSLLEGKSSPNCCHVVTLNPEMLMQGEQNPDLAQALRSATLALPDGAGLVWALRSRGEQVSRVPGIEFSEALLERAAQDQRPVALIGATGEALEAAATNLKLRHPGLNITYTHHGFFPPSEDETIARECAATQPKIVLVALGVPRQELWIARHKALFPGAILIGVGGSLDVWSGNVQRAPALLRKLNLEWFYRIASQPFGKQGRLKRTYKTLPMFVVKVLLSKGGRAGV